jgi:tetratricopeptide (TPR) repeat protein
MRNLLSALCLLLILGCFAFQTATARVRSTANSLVQQTPASADEEAEKAELKAALSLPPIERIEKYKAFVTAHPNSTQKMRAQELIVSTRAQLGDEKLRAGDAPGGLEQFRLAIADTPAPISDKLFAEILSRIPINLYVLGQRAASLEIARSIEERVKGDARRLLTIASFYLNVEEPEDGARAAELAIKVAPEMAAAHYALGAALHIALKLDEAAAEYARAVELDPKLINARRSLADLRRASGKAEEALALYRELVQAEPSDKAARAGLVLALFDAGKKEEAERELDAALKADERNFMLLAGAAYWFIAHNDSARALELAQRAVEIEPRYTWAQIALARALTAQRRPLEAEQALRVARQYGRFPTLDYELASALASEGLYEEAAEELARSFVLKDGQIETRLAGRVPAHNAGFIELLAPERRAGLFQSTAADNETDARLLKGLLAFNSALNPQGGREAVKETDAALAAKEFAAGDDAMRAFRQLYAASRLQRSGVAAETVLELTEGAVTGVDAAIAAPAATVATLADELRAARASAIAKGTPTPAVPDVPRNVLGNILRGRIEDITGWVFFNQDKLKEATEHLQRAVSVLPESSVYWRAALWHLGAALAAGGNRQEALTAYMKSYDRNAPDAARRAVIEALYRQVNGSLDGFEDKLIASSSASSNIQSSFVKTPPEQTSGGSTTQAANNSAEAGKGSEAAASSTPPQPTPQPAPEPTSQASTPETTATLPASSQTTKPDTPAQTKPEKEAQSSDGCMLAVSESVLSLKSNGGSASITVTLTGANSAAKVTPTTSNWPDITVFAGPTGANGTFTFTVNSISKRAGTYLVTFASPCGSQDVNVIVK